jgi:hypothetical protein
MTQAARLSDQSLSAPALYLRWVGANALAEFVGLGGSFLIVGGTLTLIDADSLPGLLVTAALSIAMGTLLEGVLVGLLQHAVLRRPLPAIARRQWVRATALGALIAWTLGMIPSTAMQLAANAQPAADAAAAPPAEPPQIMIYLLAAVMGLILGPILATPQANVLKDHVREAWVWVAANALAWAVGMMIIFVGTSFIPNDMHITAGVIAALVGFVALGGAAVGAVHGVALLWLIRRPLS